MGSILPVSREGILLPGGPQTRDPRLFAVPDGLVGYWGCSADCSISSTLTADLTPSRNNGTLSGTTKPSLAQGQVADALSFDGSTSYVDMGDPSDGSLDFGTGPFSITFWFNATTTLAGNREIPLVSKTNNFKGIAGWAIEISTYAGISSPMGSATQFNINTYFSADAAGNSYVPWTPAGNLATGVWHHYCLMRVGSTATHYANGQAAGSVTNSNVAASVSNAINFVVGQRLTWQISSYAGRFGSLGVYNRALSPWEVLQLYQAGLSGRRDAGMWMPGDVEMGMIGRPRGLPPFQRMVA